MKWYTVLLNKTENIPIKGKQLKGRKGSELNDYYRIQKGKVGKLQINDVSLKTIALAIGWFQIIEMPGRKQQWDNEEFLEWEIFTPLTAPS